MLSILHYFYAEQVSHCKILLQVLKGDKPWRQLLHFRAIVLGSIDTALPQVVGFCLFFSPPLSVTGNSLKEKIYIYLFWGVNSFPIYLSGSVICQQKSTITKHNPTRRYSLRKQGFVIILFKCSLYHFFLN